jgi:membrane dipeptidase
MIGRIMRLIDLHVDWPLQYAAETTLFDPELYPEAGPRASQAEGYLGSTSAAVVALFRRAEDWERQADPWRALRDLLTRVEAEFAGRLLIGPADVARWGAEPDALTWAMVGVEGFDALVRGPADLDRLPGLFARGVRVFQPLYSKSNALGGSPEVGDDRGLTGLGRDFLGVLAGLAGVGARPALDLAHMNPRCMSEALDWFEADPSRLDRVAPIYSHGAPAHDSYAPPRAITTANLTRLRALGGLVGIGVTPPFFETPEELKATIERAASIPYLGRAGFEGLALGTDFLGVEATMPGLGNAGEVLDWFASAFGREAAVALLWGNAREWIVRLLGGASGAGAG